jgi:hypothetical protein
MHNKLLHSLLSTTNIRDLAKFLGRARRNFAKSRQNTFMLRITHAQNKSVYTRMDYALMLNKQLYSTTVNRNWTTAGLVTSKKFPERRKSGLLGNVNTSTGLIYIVLFYKEQILVCNSARHTRCLRRSIQHDTHV